MNRAGHRAVGLATGLALAAGSGWPFPQALAAGLAATLTAGGRTSPDIDQTLGWRDLDTLLPDEWLGHGGPLGHRRATHWWGLPAIAALFLHNLQPGWWLAWAALAGWASHLVADWWFGLAVKKRMPSGAWVTVVPQGIPIAPWWAHHGLGWFRSDGRACQVAERTCWGISAILLWHLGRWWAIPAAAGIVLWRVIAWRIDQRHATRRRDRQTAREAA